MCFTSDLDELMNRGNETSNSLSLFSVKKELPTLLGCPRHPRIAPGDWLIFIRLQWSRFSRWDGWLMTMMAILKWLKYHKYGNMLKENSDCTMFCLLNQHIRHWVLLNRGQQEGKYVSDLYLVKCYHHLSYK